MGRIQVGISSWADAELVACGFYPPGLKKPGERLKYYSSKFSVTEIDSSFHFFPTRHNLSLWLNSTPDGFTFIVKAFSLFSGHPTRIASLPRSIREKYAGFLPPKDNLYLHHFPADAVSELWAIYSATIESFFLSGKLGAVLFQFPPWFYPEEANYDYLGSLREKLPSYPLALEFRTVGWLDSEREKTLKFLREREMTLVCVDEPQGFKSSLPPLAEVTSQIGMIRFHGRNQEKWEDRKAAPTDKLNYLYSRKELAQWLPKIRGMAEKCRDLYLIFKNKHADFPVRNALEMIELLSLT